MVKGQDVVIVLALLGLRVPPTLSELSERLAMNPATIHRGLERLEQAGLVTADREVRAAQADEFLYHGLRYVSPGLMSGEARGIPTAGAAPPLREVLAPSDEPQPVWPHPRGDARGIALEPIYPGVPEIALRDPEMYERLALTDGLRIGDARLRNLAREQLRSHFVPKQQ